MLKPESVIIFCFEVLMLKFRFLYGIGVEIIDRNDSVFQLNIPRYIFLTNAVQAKFSKYMIALTSKLTLPN